MNRKQISEQITVSLSSPWKHFEFFAMPVERIFNNSTAEVSVRSAAHWDICCETVMSVDVKAESEYEDVRIV